MYDGGCCLGWKIDRYVRGLVSASVQERVEERRDGATDERQWAAKEAVYMSTLELRNVAAELERRLRRNMKLRLETIRTRAEQVKLCRIVLSCALL